MYRIMYASNNWDEVVVYNAGKWYRRVDWQIGLSPKDEFAEISSYEGEMAQFKGGMAIDSLKGMRFESLDEIQNFVFLKQEKLVREFLESGENEEVKKAMRDAIESWDYMVSRDHARAP